MRRPEPPERLRLLAVPGSMLESGLSAARMRGPSDAQIRALEATLAASLGALAVAEAASAAVDAAAAAVPTASTGAAALVPAGALKVTAALVALVATGGGGLAVYRRAARPNPPAIAAAHAGPANRSPRPPAVPSFPEAEPEPRVEAVLPEPAAAPSSTLPSTTPSIDVGRITTAAHPRRRPAALDDLALIARAQRTLANDAARALALVEENRGTLAQSDFAQEAEVIAVAALGRLGQMDEARERAARFLVRFPESVHASRMRRMAAIIK